MKRKFHTLLGAIVLISLTGCSIENKKLYVSRPDSSIYTPIPPSVVPTKSPEPIPSPTPVLPSKAPETPSPSITPKPTPDNQDVEDETEQSEKISYNYGDKGDGVKKIQERLIKFGYRLITDGNFGAETQGAVISFQSRSGMDADGIVGPLTMAKLMEEPTSETMYDPDTSIPAFDYTNTATLENYINVKELGSDTNFYIWVDLKMKKVNIFQGVKGQWKLIRSMACSVGAPATPTIKGFFKIQDRGTMFRAGSNTICKYWTRFHNGYLFHTVLLNNDGSIQDGRLGMELSHGCVRLAIDDAKFIYENIPAGTAVWSAKDM